MKHKKLFLLWSLCGALTATAAVTTPTVKLAPAGEVMQLTPTDNAAWKKAILTPFMYDGKTKKFADVELKITETDNTVTVVWETAQWRYTTRFSAREKLILGESTLTNLTDKELFLEPGFAAQVTFNDAPEIFWDGFGVMRQIGKEKLVRNGIKGKLMKHISSKTIPFSASAVMNKSCGIQLGHVMFDPVSYSASSYDPANQELRFSQRVAIHPRETLQLRWVAGAFTAAYGGAEAAVQQHYDAFPQLWTVAGGQDNPHVWGNHSHYRTWWIKPNPEEARRFRNTCEWTYTPYKRSGDMLCRAEQWDYKPNNKFREPRPRFGGKSFSFGDISREDFLKLRRELYHKYGQRYGWMFYNTCSGTWCELKLATTKYADALTLDTSSPILLKNWSTGHDWERRVFPMGTSFAADFEADMKKLTEELNLPGFALDCGSGGVYYRGPAVKKHLPGRAWDEEGVFIDQGVAVNHQVDFIHALRPGKISVFINGPLKGDLVMYEESLVELSKLQNLMPLYKWHAGPRPTVSHGHGWEYQQMLPFWRNKTQAEFIDIMTKMSDHMIFSSFQLAINSTYIVMTGNPQQIYILPEYEELKRAGWNAVTPVKLSDSIYAPYKSSYGKAENSFLFFANSRPADCSGTVKVDNLMQSRQADTSLLFVRKLRKQATTVNRVADGFTGFDLALPSRVPVLFESVCAIKSGNGKFTATVSTDKHLEKQSWQVVFSDCGTFTAKIAPRQIRNFKFAGLTLNGKPIDPDTEVTLKSGDILAAQYTSDVFKLSNAALDKLPFISGDKESILCRLYVPAGDQGAQEAAERFNEFFRFLHKHKALKRQIVAPVTSNASSLKRPDVIAFATGAKENTISQLPGGGIKIQARTADELYDLVCKFLDEMDKRYPCYAGFQPVMGLRANMIHAVRMTGKLLPLRQYFE